MKRASLITLILCGIVPPTYAQWTPQASGTRARLRGLSVVSARVAWASGSGGTCLRTTNGGDSWVPRVVPGAEELDFRDVHAFDVDTAFLLSIGPGALSRIYKTPDGGASWMLRYQNTDPKVFLDALAFWDPDHGIALGDPVDGRFVILTTDDAGMTWTRIPPERLPEALPGEGAFAASGTCLIVQGDRNVWFGTGGARSARVFRSTDRGRTWSVHETPVRAGKPSAGIFSLAFRDASNGVAIGGDYKTPDEVGGYVARTDDGGRTWTPIKGRPPAGYRSAVSFVGGEGRSRLVAVGPTGTDLSVDGGESWTSFGTRGFDTVGFAERGAGWAAGEGGRVERYREPLPRSTRRLLRTATRRPEVAVAQVQDWIASSCKEIGCYFGEE